MQIKLKTGTLNITSDNHRVLQNLTGFGSRANKKRGFVFVNKVLGNHYPTKPSVMENIYAQLADRIKMVLNDQPTMVIGFAETATGLSYGVYHHLGLPNSFYIHTTRFMLSQSVWLNFQEEHCHAPNHLLYEVDESNLFHLRNQLENVVLIDDEFFTGKTLSNLVNTLRKKLPQVKRFIAASILDWMPKELPNMTCVSLHKGDYSFDWCSNAQLNTICVSEGRSVLDEMIPHNFGRLGIQSLNIACHKYVDAKAFRHKKVLVLGTGEFKYPAFLIAKHLEENEVDVFVQTTTRSPLNVDGDIQGKIRFKEHYYDEHIDNFLYNTTYYDSIIICYETTTLSADHNLPEMIKPYADEVITLFFRL